MRAGTGNGADAVNDPTRFTVVIPAHNEEAVIARCLQTLLADAPAGHQTEVIVVANGCTDNTVEVARQAAPQAIVLDLEQGSKSLALNAGHERASHYPRVFLDADIRCDYASLAALAEALRQPGAMAASPALRMDLSRSSGAIRSYYKVWMTQPYVTRNMVGSGCYGLSQAAHERIGPFPPITGDDIWVHSRFPEEERTSVREDADGKPVFFTVSPPLTARDQVRVETRRRLGNEEMKRLYPSPHYSGSNNAGDLRLALDGGASLFDVATYLAIKLVARIRMIFMARPDGQIVWERDTAAREVSQP